MTGEGRECFTITADFEDEGERLDVFLASNIDKVTRSFVQNCITDGKATVNGKVCRQKSYRLCDDDKISLDMPQLQTTEAQAQDIPLDIVYEDDDVVVINKPRGLVVHPAAGNMTGTLVNGLLYHCKNLSGINGKIRPGIVHRIDKDTTGLLVAAKNDMAHISLSQQLSQHSVTRVYEALAHGVFKEDEGTVDAPIGRHHNDRVRMAVVKDGGKEAVTHYRVVKRFDRFTHLEMKLETGRTHQIRVHMAYINHPLAGDFVYGPGKKVFGMNTQLLHARTLGFTHPRTGRYIEFNACLPQSFEDVLKKLEKG